MDAKREKNLDVESFDTKKNVRGKDWEMEMFDEELSGMEIEEYRRAPRNVNEVHQEQLSRGDLLADRLAKIAGNWGFIIAFGIMLGLWILINGALGSERALDPFPFILLNLILSCLAAIQAPIILMSQNRQESKDRIAAEQDYVVNLKSEAMVEEVLRRIDQIEQKLDQISEAQR